MSLWWTIACGPAPVHVPEPGTGDTAAPPTCAPAATCLGAGPDGPDQRLGYARVAAAPDGAIWASYGLADQDHLTDLWVVRSPAPGELDLPVAVPLEGVVFAGATERPGLAVGGSRLAVATTSTGALRHGNARTVWLAEGELAGADVRFLPSRLIEQVSDATEAPVEGDRIVEHPNVAYGPGDEAFVLWKRQVWGSWDQAAWARASDDFAPAPVSDQLSTAHDCSPPDFRVTAAGAPLLAVREHAAAELQTAVVRGDVDGFGAVARVSDDRYPYNVDVCPEDGPRVLERADGRLVSAWLAPADGVLRVHTAGSDDGGATWSTPAVDLGGHALGHRWVALVERDGELWVAVENVDRSTELVAEDGARDRLTTPDGREVGRVELAAAGDRAVAVGVDDAGFVRLLELVSSR